MVELNKQAKVALFSQDLSLIETCRTEIEKQGAEFHSFLNFCDIADPRLREYQLVIADVEHPDESAVHWLENLRQFPALQNLPVILASAFMTDAQAEALRKQYPNSSQIVLRVPVSEAMLRSLLAYYLKREGQIAMTLPKAVGAENMVGEEAGVFVIDEDENVSIKELYERQLTKDQQQEVLSSNAEVIDLKERQPQKSIYQEKDIDALHRYVELHEKDITRLSDALNRTHERLDQSYATVDHVRLEHTKLKKEKEDMEVKYLSLKDEFERFRMSSQREKQALIEDYQIKLAHKEMLESGYRDMQHRLQEFKKRIRDEVKIVRKHEQELEHKLQILHADTDLLIKSKDERILELTKKIEELYDQVGRLNDRIRRSEETVVGQSDRQTRVLKALRLASSLLEEPEQETSETEEKAS